MGPEETLSQFEQIIETVGRAVDAAGVAVIVIGIVVATTAYLLRVAQRHNATSMFKDYRQGLGRALLLGLEVLVAADIIRTVAIQPTFQSVGILAGIVVIRTFLSWSLEVELEGRWPWQHQSKPSAGTLGSEEANNLPPRRPS